MVDPSPAIAPLSRRQGRRSGTGTVTAEAWQPARSRRQRNGSRGTAADHPSRVAAASQGNGAFGPPRFGGWSDTHRGR